MFRAIDIELELRRNSERMISDLPMFWNGILLVIGHGYTPDDVYADKEGVYILEILADNMTYIIRVKI